MGIVLCDLALLRVVQQRHDEARSLCAEGIVLSQEFGDRRGYRLVSGDSLGSRGGGADGAARGPAARRDGGSARERRRTRSRELQQMDWRSLPRRHEADLGDSVFDAAVAEGRTMSLSRAIQLGLEDETPSS